MAHLAARQQISYIAQPSGGPMAEAKTAVSDGKTRHQRFVEMARELGADTDPEAFRSIVRKVATANTPPRPRRPLGRRHKRWSATPKNIRCPDLCTSLRGWRSSRCSPTRCTECWHSDNPCWPSVCLYFRLPPLLPRLCLCLGRSRWRTAGASAWRSVVSEPSASEDLEHGHPAAHHRSRGVRVSRAACRSAHSIHVNRPRPG
jgi:hypothetical protein